MLNVTDDSVMTFVAWPVECATQIWQLIRQMVYYGKIKLKMLHLNQIKTYKITHDLPTVTATQSLSGR